MSGIEVPRVLTVDTDPRWLSAMKTAFEAREVDFTQVKEAERAIEELNSGDFTSIIMDGLRGEWRTLVDEASQLDVQSIVLTRSNLLIHELKGLGITVFSKDRSLSQEGISPIIDAALTLPEPVQLAA